MADLSARTPCEGLLPLKVGGLSVTEDLPGAMTVLGPFRGQDKALSAALKAAHGMALPSPGRATGRAGARAIWFARGQVMLAGPRPDVSLGRHAALVDQSDGWAVVRLHGAGAGDVLARLVPLDLRAQVFRRGATARSDLAHMLASLTRTGDNAFQIMVFRSMAVSLVEELKIAMEAVAARG